MAKLKSLACLFRRLPCSRPKRGHHDDSPSYMKISEQNGMRDDESRKYFSYFSLWISELRETTDAQKKRVVVVTDDSKESKVGLLWAFSHFVNDGDTVILLQLVENDVLPAKFRLLGSGDTQYYSVAHSYANEVAKSLIDICNSRFPEVKIIVELLALHGEKCRATVIINHARKLRTTILILGQNKPSMLHRILPISSKKDEIVQTIIDKADCMALGIRKQKRDMGGYIINSKWQKNFWLLASSRCFLTPQQYI